VLRRAAAAWEAGRPHEALDILSEAGMREEYWPQFQRTALGHARARYLREISRYQAAE
jgi:hypothetical protein